jgi:hypothetical protein
MKTHLFLIFGILLNFSTRYNIAAQVGIQHQPLHQVITVFNATQFRVMLSYLDEKGITRKEPLATNASTSIDYQVGTLVYSVGDLTDRVFPATQNMFAGVVLTLTVPPAIQDLLTRSMVANVTSVAQTVANRSIPTPPPASAPPVPQGTNAHLPLVVPLSSPETIHYTLPGLGAPVR